MKDELNKLADRVESLTGPDRGVDALVGVAFGAAPKTKNVYKRNRYPLQLLRVAKVYPTYTRSLEAALSLVPEGARRVEFGSYREGDCWAYVHTPDDTVGESEGAANEASAVTVAALRARAEVMK
jgi:hypothetical protein